MKRWAGDAAGLRDAATLLPVTAAILLLPPFILVFAAPVLISGVPLIVIYLFGVWAAVVFLAWLLARRLAKADAGAEGEAEARSSPEGH